MKRLILSIAIVSACAFAQGSTGTTSTTITTNYVFPPVGLANGLTASVSLVNISPASTASNATAPVCTGTVTFANAKGTTIGTPTPFSVGTGVIESVALSFASAGITASRGEILASVQHTTTRPSTAPCTLVFSLEVYDSNGETHVFLGNASATTPPSSPMPEFIF
jgi:hypothetical protein